MGSMVEINDTLRISKAQGFPAELEVDKHLKDPYKLEDFVGKTFEFHSKPKVRMYHHVPTRIFLVEEVKGKWIYWGLCIVTEVTHDHEKKETAGKFKIIYINSPDEMKKAFQLIDRRFELDYFGQKP